MFNADDFARLQFLEGRWKGEAPDGTPFYEEYDRPEPSVFRSRRFTDATFSEHTDGSTITLKDGEVVSQWGEFTWRAAGIDGDSASFDPVNAPSHFSWHRIDDMTLEARQRWTADGKEQRYTITMTRIAND
ncbi:hypothetical protein [Telluria beijingensis]|uniref:hypothetical protein n=1 Tax=Telluria beijingensis TaxID=3068633 RepID=UPI00279533C6|nr:hypothetical protein [Massilia sp. REN29]